LPPSGFLHGEFCLKPFHPSCTCLPQIRKGKKNYTRHNVRRAPNSNCQHVTEWEPLPGLESPISARHKARIKPHFGPPSCWRGNHGGECNAGDDAGETQPSPESLRRTTISA
jgi:hypothetical protein